MERNKRWLLLVVAIAMLLSGCKVRDANAGPDKMVRACKDTNHRFEKQYNQLKLPDHLRQENPSRLASDFDLQAFLEGFEGIKVNENYKVDYVYQYRNVGGHPVLYSINKITPPFKTEKEYDKGKGFNFLNALEVDGSPKGFLELAMIGQLAPNFYLYFQGFKQQTTFICNIDDVELVLDELENMESAAQPNMLVIARALTMDNIEPTVKIDDVEHIATVNYVTFSKWGGFYSNTVVFSTYFPHKIISLQHQSLIEYDSGIEY